MKKFMKSALVFALILPLGFLLVACGDNGTKDDYELDISQPVVLSAPSNVSVANQVVYWNHVPNAIYYGVTINNADPIVVETTYLDASFMPGREYKIAVAALGHATPTHVFETGEATIYNHHATRTIVYSDFTDHGGTPSEIENGIRIGQSRHDGGSTAFIGTGLEPNRKANFFHFDLSTNYLEKGQFIALELGFNNDASTYTDSLQFGVVRCDDTGDLYATTLGGGLNFAGTFAHMMQSARMGNGHKINSLGEIRFETDFANQLTTIHVNGTPMFSRPMTESVVETRYYWFFTNVAPHFDLTNVRLG